MQSSTVAQQAVTLSLSEPKLVLASKASLYVVNGLPPDEDAVITSLIAPEAQGNRWGIYRIHKDQLTALADRYACPDEALLALNRMVADQSPT